MTSRYEEVMKTKPYLPFKLGYLTEDMVVKAEKELKETEEVKAKCIPELRKMVEKETKLVCPTTDAYMLQYLRARKYDVKKAFSLLQGYYQVKKSFSDVYDTFDYDVMKRLFALKAIMCLPYRDEHGCIIVWMKMANWDPDVSTLGDICLGLTMIVLHAIEDPASQICGFRVFFDVRGASFKQARCITPRYMLLFSRGLRNTLAARFKSIHILNESTIFQYVWSLLKLFLSQKIKNRVHFHGDSLKSLHQHIPKTILPAEYGGDNPQDIGDWYNSEIEKYFEKTAELVTYGYRD